MNEKSSLLGGHKNHTNADSRESITQSLRASVVLQKKYPEPFFDPVTKEIMKDPVVAPSGTSYEKSTWQALCRNHTQPSAPAYENRALKQIINETIVETNNIRQRNFRRSSRVLGMKLQHNIRKNIEKVMEKSILPTDDSKALSEAYYCPITMALMKQPVIGPEGFSFEREAIEQWIDKNEVSPLTRTPLPSKRLLYPNLALQEMLKLEISHLKEHDQSQSIRDYKSYLETGDQEQGYKNVSYDGPKTLEDWKALRVRQRHSNAQYNCSGFVQFLYLICLLIFGVVVGIVLGIVALILATVLDILLAPIFQCFCPGGCRGGSDPFGDDEVPFINGFQSYSLNDDEALEEVTNK